jgi:hypothetical protein
LDEKNSAEMGLPFLIKAVIKPALAALFRIARP